MSDPVRIDKNWWRDGLHTAEELYKLGFYFDGVDDIGGYVFNHPEGGSSTYHFGDNYQNKKGMMDYVAHRKNNPEIFKC